MSLHTFAVSNYRSIRDLTLSLGQLNLVTGANGSGKSNLYRALKLLCDTARGDVIRALALEGGLPSVLWAGPESFSPKVKRGEHPVQGGPRKDPVSLRLGFTTDDFGYGIDIGMPTPVPRTMFSLDPEIKREVIWHGDTWHTRRALIDRRGGLVRARGADGEWRVIEQHLASFDSVVSRLADPSGTPEALVLREELRSWRFYEHFRCDSASPAPCTPGRRSHPGTQQRRSRPCSRLAHHPRNRRRRGAR